MLISEVHYFTRLTRLVFWALIVRSSEKNVPTSVGLFGLWCLKIVDPVIKAVLKANSPVPIFVPGWGSHQVEGLSTLSNQADRIDYTQLQTDRPSFSVGLVDLLTTLTCLHIRLSRQLLMGTQSGCLMIGLYILREGEGTFASTPCLIRRTVIY